MIRYWNREKKILETESVYGDAWVRAIYETRPGQFLAESILSRKTLSQIYGMYQSTSFSRHKIDSFIKNFRINMEEYEEGPFCTFNDFFVRKFKNGKRIFTHHVNELPAFAEGRYFAYERIEKNMKYFVKGQYLTADALLENPEDASQFENGPLVIVRLCPTDYHRFHFPDDGKVLKSYPVHGALHSVNPLALKYRGDIFATNERRVSILETKNFGKLAYIEIGALCVGMIVQTHSGEVSFKRGDEKGYFLFGGSTVILIGESGKWRPDPDLVDQTKNGRETFIKLGERIASKYI